MPRLPAFFDAFIARSIVIDFDDVFASASRHCFTKLTTMMIDVFCYGRFDAVSPSPRRWRWRAMFDV